MYVDICIANNYTYVCIYWERGIERGSGRGRKRERERETVTMCMCRCDTHVQYGRNPFHIPAAAMVR